MKGDLAPEEEGWFLYSLKQASAEEMRRGLPDSNYARFLSADAVELAQIYRWVPQAHRQATIQSLQREGLLVIWDASNEGLSKFLSEEFSVE